jgi:hypothetical protein
VVRERRVMAATRRVRRKSMERQERPWRRTERARTR